VSDKRLTDSELAMVDRLLCETFDDSQEANWLAGKVPALLAEVREHRTRTAPAGLTQEERELLEDARFCVAFAVGAFEDRFGNGRAEDKAHRVRIMSCIDRLASTAPAPPGVPTEDERDAVFWARAWVYPAVLDDEHPNHAQAVLAWKAIPRLLSGRPAPASGGRAR
jgi:hypothetical protein